MVLCTEPYMIA